MSTDKQSIDWYNNNAKGYSDHVRNTSDSVYHAYYEKPAMYNLVPDIKDKDILSLGYGSGEDISYLKKLGTRNATGIDISSELIKIAKDDYPECSFEIMDMEQLGFEDNSFDFMYSSLAIHYIENWTIVLKEAYRVLKPGSLFLFSCNHPVTYSMKGADTEEKWISKLEVVKNKNTRVVSITGDYINSFRMNNVFGKDTVNYWHKSFGEISKEIHSAGFVIEQIVEPLPLKELEAMSPEVFKRLSKIPEFVIFRLLKA